MKLKIVYVCFGLLLGGIVLTSRTTVPTDTETESITETVTETETDVTIEFETDPPTITEPLPETETESETVTETEIPTETETESETEEVTYYCVWGDFYITQEEYELLLTTVFCEIGGETPKEQHAVSCAILNQINSGRFGKTVHKVIYRKNNFSVTKWKDFEKYGWTDEVEQSFLLALEYNPYPRNMFYFRTGHFHTFVGAVDYKKIGKLYFSTN